MVGELRASHVIHLHRLMAAVRAEFEDEGMDDDRLANYRDHGIVPTDFKTTKAEHERALLTLSASLSEWAAERTQTTASDRATGSRDNTDPAPDAEESERVPEASASR
jgi:Predicted metal-binding protein